ncbi:MAG: hemolysin III family protein [Proteobacteria bacterium]|nr:hemolysin III family protein [Pseudomonadota bacterium]MBU1742326.1 hemolysin III family protein [Pseudomonadota bacterium]
MTLKDPVSGLSHLAGAVLAAAGLGALVVLSALHRGPWHLVSFVVYGASLVLLYTASAVYHLLPLSAGKTLTWRRLDHIMIYVLIAGTYTPFCLVALRGVWGWSIFGAVWGLALAGLFLKLFWISAPRWMSTALYLVMGWVGLVAIHPIVKAVPIGGLVWLLAGGVFYSVGAVIYGLRRPDPWPGVFGFHELFHLFVLAGSLCHFYLMVRYLLWLP